MVYCVAKNCRTKSGQGIHLFTFPKDSERRELWIGNINRENFEPAPHSRLCALHFTPDQFVINPELAKSIGYTSKRNDLKDTAVPTVFKKDIKRKKSNSAQLKTLDLEEKDKMVERTTCQYDESVVANIKQEAPDIDESQGYPYYYGDSQNGEQSNDDPFEQSFPLHPGLIDQEAQTSQETDEESVGNNINDGAMFMTLTQELNQQGELFDNNAMEENMEEDDVKNDRGPNAIPNDETFRCKYCCIRFVSFQALSEHINRLHQNKYKCRYCKKRFVRCQELAGHVRQTHLKGGSRETAKLDENDGHSNNTDADDSKFESPDFIPYEVSDFGSGFRCLYCYAKLSSEVLVKDHIKRLHTSKYKCKYCSKTFNRSQELAGHVRKSHLEDKLLFDVYKKHRPVSSFSQPDRKSFDHVSVKSFQKVKAKVTLLSTGYSKYKCGYCSMVFFKQQAMACHVRNAHKSKKAPGSQKVSNGRMAYKRKKKRYKVDKNQEEFQSENTESKTELQSEMNAESTPDTENRFQKTGYTEIKSEYTCKYCMLIFERSQDLASHTRISHPVICSHWCKYCPSTFTTKDRLIDHVLRHLRQEFSISKKGFSSCHICKLRYSAVSGLRKHMKIHFKGKFLDSLSECEFCGQPFLLRKSCEEHEKKHKIINQETKRERKMEMKKEKEVTPMSEKNSVKDEGKVAVGDIPIKDGGKLTLDDIPFQCGMCTSRFPNSQYLLHHITLHMEGKYVFKVERDKGKEQQEQSAVMKCNSNLTGVIGSKQIIIPRVSNIPVDMSSSKPRIIYVTANKTSINSIGEVGGDPNVTEHFLGDTIKKQANSAVLDGIKSILKTHLGKNIKEKKEDDKETCNKNGDQIELEAKNRFSMEGLPKFEKIAFDKMTPEMKGYNHDSKRRSEEMDADSSDNDYVSNCLIEENKHSGDNQDYPLMADTMLQKQHNKPRSKKTKFKKGIDFANGQWQECEFCMFLCKNQSEYENHMEGHKKSSATLINCRLCSRKFVSKWHLNKHMESHKDNEYQCTICQASFSTSFQVLEHMSVHANVNSS